MYLNGFETERLVIRKLREEDSIQWFEFFKDKQAYEFIGLDAEVAIEDHLEGWMDRQFRRYQNDEYGLMAIIEKESGQLLGQAGIITMNVKSVHELEIGYHIIKKYRGRGFAGEASRAFIDFVFANKLAKSIIAVININNEPSKVAAIKLGMNKECDTVCMDRPAFIYRIKKEKWDGIKQNPIP